MAIASTPTLLSLDEYAQVMAIPGWLLAQVYHPERPTRGACENIWYQSGYMGTGNRIVEREELARAIANAEEQMADYMGFWPGPRWVMAEPHEWPINAQGYSISNPSFISKWGHLIEFGIEAWVEQEDLYPVLIDYSDRDKDGCLDWATLTFATTITNACEIVVVPPGKDPTDREWAIRPLKVEIDAGTCTIEGPRWLFVDPDRWWTVEELNLATDTDFLTWVDIYRHYNDISTQGQLVWKTELEACVGTTAICTEQCQSSCGVVDIERVGRFHLRSATYNAGTWTGTSLAYNPHPNLVRIWYRAGYRTHVGYKCGRMSYKLSEAIARLANVFLPEAPCGCDYTLERWSKDREEMEIMTAGIALTQSAFGTTARGAVFAQSVAAKLEPIGQGG